MKKQPFGDRATRQTALLVALAVAFGVTSWAHAAVLGSSSPQAWTPSTYPNPAKDPEACGRPGVASSWVCDPDSVISAASRNVVEGLLKGIAMGDPPYARSPCAEGFQVCRADCLTI